MNENVEFLANFSIAYKAGVEAKKLGIPLKETAIRNLLPGTPQYDDFLAGYDSLDADEAENAELRALAHDAYEAWQNDRDSKVGKLLRAMIDDDFRKQYLPGRREG